MGCFCGETPLPPPLPNLSCQHDKPRSATSPNQLEVRRFFVSPSVLQRDPVDILRSGSKGSVSVNWAHQRGVYGQPGAIGEWEPVRTCRPTHQRHPSPTDTPFLAGWAHRRRRCLELRLHPSPIVPNLEERNPLLPGSAHWKRSHETGRRVLFVHCAQNRRGNFGVAFICHLDGIGPTCPVRCMSQADGVSRAPPSDEGGPTLKSKGKDLRVRTGVRTPGRQIEHRSWPRTLHNTRKATMRAADLSQEGFSGGTLFDK